MIVRCGRCQTSFDVGGPGRYPCPSCGTTNEVREPAAPSSGFAAPPQPTAPDPPSPRVQCLECEFRFIVGAVESALCPNCGATVTVAPVSGGDA